MRLPQRKVLFFGLLLFLGLNEHVFGEVTLYEVLDFAGRAEKFYIDDTDLRNNGIGNETVTAVRVPPGCRVTLYEHFNYGGKSETFTDSDNDLRDNTIGNDTVSSLKVDCKILANNHYIARRQSWGLFPLGYWSYVATMNQHRIEDIKKYNFDSILLMNNSSVDNWSALTDISGQLNKFIIGHPAPVFNNTGQEYVVKILPDYSMFHNAGNVSFMLVDEPFVVDLFDPSRNQGFRFDFDQWSITREQLTVNQHLFFYGYTKGKAEEQLAENAKRWAKIYSSFNTGSRNPNSLQRPLTLISLSGANSQKPSFNRVFKVLLDTIIRDRAPSCRWVDNQPIPGDTTMENLAKWRAYEDLLKVETTDVTRLSYLKELYKAWFAVGLAGDVTNSLYGTSIFYNCSPQLAEVSRLLSSKPFDTLLSYLEKVPTDNLEFLEPYDILFREFRNATPPVKVDGVLTHIYSLREAAPGRPDIYRGFFLQGDDLDFSSKLDLFTYVSKPVGLSAITKVLDTVKKNMAHHGYDETPLFFTYQLSGSGTGKGLIYELLGATDPRNVNADEIRAMINVAYLSGANGAFGWTDYFNLERRSDVNSGLFNASSETPALDKAGIPRVAGVMSANQDIMDAENYLNWSVGLNRTVVVEDHGIDDNDFWEIRFKFSEKPTSEFVAVMNRRTSENYEKYEPSYRRSSVLRFYQRGPLGIQFPSPRYVREAKFPSEPTKEAVLSLNISLEPGQFRLFEVATTPLTGARHSARFNMVSSPAKIPDMMFSGKLNSIELEVTPRGITPPYYRMRVYLENGVSRVLLYKNDFADAGTQRIHFEADVPVWPLVDNRLVVTVETPGVLHQELYRRDVKLYQGGIDSEEDGLTDYDELYRYHTNPYNTDSDEDDLPDGQEIARGTDPNKRDTDGDGIDDGKDVYPLDPLQWTYDITPVLQPLLLNPVTDLPEVGRQ